MIRTTKTLVIHCWNIAVCKIYIYAVVLLMSLQRCQTLVCVWNITMRFEVGKIIDVICQINVVHLLKVLIDSTDHHLRLMRMHSYMVRLLSMLLLLLLAIATTYHQKTKPNPVESSATIAKSAIWVRHSGGP